jgi:hypothetical protein
MSIRGFSLLPSCFLPSRRIVGLLTCDKDLSLHPGALKSPLGIPVNALEMMHFQPIPALPLLRLPPNVNAMRQ